MFHEPVLAEKAVELLINNQNGVYLDGTVGGGGHAEAILKNLGAQGKLIALDLDQEALRFANQRLKKYKNKIIIKQGNFKEFNQILNRLKIANVDGILLDLGVSSHQIDTATRGFSFSLSGKLDMRMDPNQKLTAYEIINFSSEDELYNLFKEFGEEKRSRAVARCIIKERKTFPIMTTKELRDVMSKALPYPNRVKSLARLFQAVRMRVNDEVNNLKAALKLSLDYVKPSGRIVVISYHSGEDRIVKNFFKSESEKCTCPVDLPVCVCGKKGRVKILTRRPIRPDEDEVSRNPRCRSGRLRAAEVIA